MNWIKFLLLSFVLVLPVVGQTTTSISRFGVTFNFSAPVEFGQFVNGDYWVQGPVTVVSMDPPWDPVTERSGWMLNPVVLGQTAFSGNGVPGYNASLRPPLPLTITQGSLIKAVGQTADAKKPVKSAAVLTVLPDIPPGRGANYFRPPYFGTAKPLYAVSSLRTDLLPTYVPPANTPTLASVLATFSKGLRLENFNYSRYTRPQDVMNDYGPANAPEVNEAMLRLMCNDTVEQKMPALIMFTQFALDKAQAVFLGFRRSNGDGHDPNHRVVAAWGATLLDLENVKTVMATATNFHEDAYLYQGVNAVLWGQPNSELSYWNFVMGLGGNRSNKDPYGYVDGGFTTSGAGAYQIITSQSLKGTALVFKLFPQLQQCIPQEKFDLVYNYSKRWVTIGQWTSPDPVAPFDGNVNNYGITFGPNGSGSFIAGAGRNPSKHGTSPDSGQYKSIFVANMWNSYEATLVAGDTAPPTFQSALINATGTAVQVTFSENVQGVNAAHYTISGGSALSSPVTAGRIVTFTASPALVSGTTYVLGYTSGADRTTDIAGNLLATFSNQPVTNNSLETLPTPPRAGNLLKSKSTGRRGAFSQ